MTDHETALIGAIVLDPARVIPIAVQDGITAASFTDPASAAAWVAVHELYAHGKPFGAVTVAQKSGLTYPVLEAWADSVDSVAHAEYYIEQIRQAERVRMAIAVASETQRTIETTDPANIDETISAIQTQWAQFGIEPDKRTLVQVGRMLVDEWKSPDKAKRLIEWPLPILNRLLGYVSDELIYICARESVGKTAFALQWAVAVARGDRRRVAIASLESKRDKIVPRLISHIGKVNTFRLKNKGGHEEDFARAEQALTEMAGLPIAIADHGMTTDQIRAFGQSEKARGAAMLIVDNTKHIRPSSSMRTRGPVEQFRALAQDLKWIRDDLGLTVVVLHHLNKDGDVSWCDDVRKDADFLLFLEPVPGLCIAPTPQNNWTSKTILEVKVEKGRETGNRNARPRVEFIGAVQTFTEVIE